MVDTSGEWREERLFVLREIDRLEREGKERTVDLALLRTRVEEKAGKAEFDVHQAHEKIRALERSRSSIKLKLWATSAAASFLGVVVIELLRMVLKH